MSLQPESKVQRLQDKVKELEGEVAYLEGLVTALITGDMPERCDITTMIYAIRGRRFNQFLELSARESQVKNSYTGGSGHGNNIQQL